MESLFLSSPRNSRRPEGFSIAASLSSSSGDFDRMLPKMPRATPNSGPEPKKEAVSLGAGQLKPPFAPMRGVGEGEKKSCMTIMKPPSDLSPCYSCALQAMHDDCQARDKLKYFCKSL